MNESMPRPGEHLSVPAVSVRPEDVVEKIEELLAELDTVPVASDDAEDAFAEHTRILEAAHEVLVGSLSAVDKS